MNINIFRSDPVSIRTNQEKRFLNVAVVDKIIALDNIWRSMRHKLDHFNSLKNLCSKEIANRYKTKIALTEPPATDIDPNIPINILENLALLNLAIIQTLSIGQIKFISQRLSDDVNDITIQFNEAQEHRVAALQEIGNILHPSVPIACSDAGNVVEYMWGDCKLRHRYTHIDLLYMIGAVDTKRGCQVAGDRGYFLLGPGVFLQQALIQHSLNILAMHEYIPIYTPFFMNPSVVGQLVSSFDNDKDMYTVMGKKRTADTDTEKYLITTSEQPLAAFHKDEVLSDNLLPLKYAGVSTCFRPEYNVNERRNGIFRVHQFEKIEQFCITTPNDGASWQFMDEMLENACEFYKTLEIPFRIVNVASGVLDMAAAKKIDIEAWFSGSGEFGELVSCTNCTDYQSRCLNIRYRSNAVQTTNNSDKQYVHTLNSTMCAVTRVMCALVETYQTHNGVIVPKALQPYMPIIYKHFIPFINDAPL